MWNLKGNDVTYLQNRNRLTEKNVESLEASRTIAGWVGVGEDWRKG